MTLPPACPHDLPLASKLQVLLPVGEAPEEVFQHYASLIVRHRQVSVFRVGWGGVGWRAIWR